MKLNLHQITVPVKVKRIYYFNPQTEPEIFAQNLSRVNNIRFIHSSDLVWVELPVVDITLTPAQVESYKKSEEVVEGDEKLFTKVLYTFIRKLFKDNNFVVSRENLFIDIRTKKPLQTNKEVCCYESYQLKIYKFDEKHYLSILPRFVFLSTKPALESNVKSAFVLNVKSGRSFPCISCEKDNLVISVDKSHQKRVSFPENYYFNFTSKDAENLGFSKELYNIYTSNLKTLYGRIPHNLNFLAKIANLEESYEIHPSNFERVVVFYRFKEGRSTSIKEIFNLKPIKNPENLKVTFVFPDIYKNEQIEEPLKRIFASSQSQYYKDLSDLGIKKIDYLRDPQSSKAIFYYDQSFNIEKSDYLSSCGNGFAIILLQGRQNTLQPLLEKVPRSLTPMPILKPKLTSTDGLRYIIKSFAYKMLNFSKEAQPYELMDIMKNTLYIGFDLSHDHQKRKSNLALAAVDSYGKVIYIFQKQDLPLNEKLNLDTLQTAFAKSVDRYNAKHGRNPDYVYLMRDGVFLEEIGLLTNYLDITGLDYVIIEVNKNSNINSEENLKGILIKLQKDRFLYFTETYNLQKGVELNIIKNRTKLTDEQIAKQIYLSTRLFHPTPFSNLKLPYPLYITDKVSLLPVEWKLYIPYFQDDQE